MDRGHNLLCRCYQHFHLEGPRIHLFLRHFCKPILHFAARTPLEVARVEEVMSRLPGARRVEDVATRYEVPIGQTPLAELFRILGEQNQEQDGMGLEYTVERLGLESVFLKVVREQNEQDK